MQKILATIMPFILLGIALVAFFLGLMLLAYIFVFGAIVGLVLYAATWIKEKFFPSKSIVKRKSSGRTIDHEE